MKLCLIVGRFVSWGKVRKGIFIFGNVHQTTVHPQMLQRARDVLFVGEKSA